MDKMKNLVWSDHLTIKEFEVGWTDLVDEFDLSKNTWLNDMFQLRSLWVPSFFNDDAMVGLLRTTSRSESSNFYFNHFVQKGDTLSEFYLCYQSALEKQRNASALLNHKDDIIPRTANRKKIEKDPAEIYTRTMYYMIEEQISYSAGDMIIDAWSTEGDMKTVKIKDPLYKNVIFEVLY